MRRSKFIALWAGVGFIVGPCLSLGPSTRLFLGIVAGSLIGYSLADYVGLSFKSRLVLATLSGVMILPLSAVLRVVTVTEVPIPPVGIPLCIGGYGLLIGAISSAMAGQQKGARTVSWGRRLLVPPSCSVGLFVGSFVALFAGYFLYGMSGGGWGGIVAGGVAGVVGGLLSAGFLVVVDEITSGQLGWGRT